MWRRQPGGQVGVRNGSEFEGRGGTSMQDVVALSILPVENCSREEKEKKGEEKVVAVLVIMQRLFASPVTEG